MLAGLVIRAGGRLRVKKSQLESKSRRGSVMGAKNVAVRVKEYEMGWYRRIDEKEESCDISANRHSQNVFEVPDSLYSV